MTCTCEYCTRRNSKKRLPTLAQISKNWSMKQKYEHAGIKNKGYLDIETSGLIGDFGIIISWANLRLNTQTGESSIKYDFIEKKDFDYAYKHNDANLIDKRLCESIVKEINTCDLLIGHWFVGKFRHDIPFIRTRCAINKVEGLPKHKQIRYGDTQKWGSTLYRLHNNGLDSIARMFNVSIHKTPLQPRVWQNACIGIKKDIKYILNHNIKDVKITSKIHKGMEEYVPIANQFY